MADDLPPSPPVERAGSPPSWISPSLAINAVPQLDRSVSTASSVSSVSGRSSSSRLSDSGIPGRRRGYMRIQGTAFSESAKSRESVMNLGTIAHLQYYFARTGLLDGKGAQHAKARKNGLRTASGSGLPPSAMTDALSYLSLSTSDQAVTDPAVDEPHLGDGLVESPIDEHDFASNWGDSQEPVMLPPTVSTYKNTPVYVAPPPDMAVLRRELRESMQEALKHLGVLEKDHAKAAKAEAGDAATSPTFAQPPDAPGWHEIQGLNLLDVVTLAIRAAKNYYTAHENTQRLYSIKSEREIRRELYQVLDVLKRMATRNFAGGIQATEVASIKSWVVGIESLLDMEEEKERLEQEERERWKWREGDWRGKEREREWLFLRSFDTDADSLPEWTDPSEGVPNAFLRTLQNGLRLVHLHNELVQKSRRQFEEIKAYHTDTAKPYRCADNLRYWVKAAELRWDVELELDVMGVVHGTDEAAWKKFDVALLKWCQGVREGILAEWRDQQNASLNKTPTLLVDPGFERS